jgi:protein-S-isoprenylcysteine O-methyltransferase Ste14
MESLETKVPPPLVAAVLALAMWGVSGLPPLLHLPESLRVSVAAAVFLVGIGFSAAGVLAFRRARTTINPTKPEHASALVRSGIYRITRNPMYVGVLCVLVAWAVFLFSVWSLLGPVVFVLYIQRFQIAPEERALGKLFGSDYANYQAKVRRWL